MSPTLYVAVAICIGTPADQLSDKSGQYVGIRLGSCDYGTWEDSGPDFTGYSAEVCLEKLKDMKEHGNIIKICVPTAEREFLGFRVEWGKGAKR